MWPHLLNMRMKAQTRRVCWPALHGFVKNKQKRGTLPIVIRSLYQPLALGGLDVRKPSPLYWSFFKVHIDRTLYFITRDEGDPLLPLACQ